MDSLLLADFIRVRREFPKSKPKEKNTFCEYSCNIKENHFSWFPVSSNSNSLEAKSEQAVLMKIFLMALTEVYSMYNKTSFQ